MIQCHVYETAKVMNIFNTCGVSCHCQYASHLHNEKCICELFFVPVKSVCQVTWQCHVRVVSFP